MAPINRDPKNDDKRGADEVPETWQGYLSDDKASSKGLGGGDGLSPSEREALERGLAPEAEEKLSGEELRERMEELGRSKADGISFAGLIPFFAAMALGLAALFFFTWQNIKPKPYDIASLAPADKNAEEIAAELIAATLSGADPNDIAKLFAGDMELLDIKSGQHKSLLGKGIASRFRETVEAIAGGDLTAVSGVAIQSSDHEGLMYMDYDRKDLTTGQATQDRLVLARVAKGWRAVGFE